MTLSETRAEIEKVARSHGWDLGELHIAELAPSENNLSADSQLTVFNPSELELGETTEALIAAANAHRPQRLVIDSLSELRLIAQNALRYRRQILALKQFFSDRDCTVLMLDDRTGGIEDDHLQSIAHGVVMLEQLANQYGAERRRLRVSKMRGVAFRGGYHDFAIRTGGLDVFPRLVAAEHPRGLRRARPAERQRAARRTARRRAAGRHEHACCSAPPAPASRRSPRSSPTAAAARGERAAIFVFDENIGTFRSRSRKLGIAIDKAVGNGLITVQQIDPAELSSGEFAAIVRRSRRGPRRQRQAREGRSSSTA